MSLEIFTKAIKEFVSSNTAEVLSIKGGWGVGKTYFWNHFISTNRNELKHPFEKYAYVSLFGISTLEELKFAIFEHLVDKNQVGKKINIEMLKDNIESVASMLGKKSIRLLSGIPLINKYVSFTALQPACFAFIKNSLICLDDFERKGKTLETKDILGLVSLLKEQKNCKVVLIFDDSKLEGDASSDYKQFREKVIDTEITYAPTAQESASLVFGDENEINNRLIGLTNKLNITNIRILRKIQRVAYSVAKALENINPEPELLQRYLPTIVLFVWCYYSHDDKNVPRYEYVKTFQFKLGIQEKNENAEKEKNWDFILRHYEYSKSDKFDLAIATVVETGFVNEDLLLEEADKMNQRIIAEKSHAAFGDAWKIYHNSFAENEKELMQAFDDSVRNNAKYISARDLETVIAVIRKLGNDNLASDLIGFYIEANKDKPEKFNLESRLPGWEIKDAEIVSKFSQITNEINEVQTLDDVVEIISFKRSWSKSDEEILASAGEEDYYKFFKRVNDDRLDLYVQACLLYSNGGNASTREREITENVKNALIRIGKESELNKMRVGRLGIKI
jgi:KAP family P-loop domain